MREIKQLTKNQVHDVLVIASKAYPMLEMTSEKKIADFEKRILEGFDSSNREWYGLFEDGKLLGSMVLYDFKINYFGADIKGCGIGFVAVDFLHKKQKICKEMLQYYLQLSKKRKYPLAMLYSFRPDFYKKMGFGYGTFCHNYVTHPQRLPRAEKHYQFRYLGLDDKNKVNEFYGSLYKKHHGMVEKSKTEIEAYLKTPGYHIAGYEENDKLLALLTFTLHDVKGTNETSRMKLEMLYTNSTGLKASLNFLHSQSDQVTEIAFSTPFKNFFFNMTDIRHMDKRVLREPGFHHTHDTGMGIMYRSLDPVKLIMNRPVELDNMKIRFILTDSFMTDSKQDFIINWKQNKAIRSKGKRYDLEIKMDVSDFTSWIMNAIDLSTLFDYGLVELSDDSMLNKINRAFYYQQQPICLQRF